MRTHTRPERRGGRQQKVAAADTGGLIVYRDPQIGHLKLTGKLLGLEFKMQRLSGCRVDGHDAAQGRFHFVRVAAHVVHAVL